MSIRCDIYDRSQYAIWFAAAPYSAAGKPAKTLRQWAADESADIVYNLALFNMTGQGSDRYGVIKGRKFQRTFHCPAHIGSLDRLELEYRAAA